ELDSIFAERNLQGLVVSKGIGGHFTAEGRVVAQNSNNGACESGAGLVLHRPHKGAGVQALRKEKRGHDTQQQRTYEADHRNRHSLPLSGRSGLGTCLTTALCLLTRLVSRVFQYSCSSRGIEYATRAEAGHIGDGLLRSAAAFLHPVDHLLGQV